MSTWNDGELDRVGRVTQVEISSRRPDGSPRPYVVIWAVRAGESLYVRSAHGSDNPWFRRALASGTGRIRAVGGERDVTFDMPEPEVADDVTAAYHAKYDRYGAAIVGTVVSKEAIRSTLRVMPA